jgi:lipopolysaccharide transport system ATP-binding protein
VSYGNRAAEIKEVGLFTLEGERANLLLSGRRYELRYRVRFLQSVRGVAFGMSVTTPDAIQVAVDSSAWHGQGLTEAKPGRCLEVRFGLYANFAPGTYYVTTGVASMESGETVLLHRRVDVLAFRVHDPTGTARGGLSYLGSDCSVADITCREADGTSIPN